MPREPKLRVLRVYQHTVGINSRRGLKSPVPVACRGTQVLILLLLLSVTDPLWGFVFPGLCARSFSVSCSPQHNIEEAERALDEAARLRREIALMEKELANGEQTGTFVLLVTVLKSRKPTQP